MPFWSHKSVTMSFRLSNFCFNFRGSYCARTVETVVLFLVVVANPNFWQSKCSVTIVYREDLDILRKFAENSLKVNLRLSRSTWSTHWTKYSVATDLCSYSPLSWTSVRPYLNFPHHCHTTPSLVLFLLYT